MKKTLALGLASAMVMSMASVAFAATSTVQYAVGGIESTPYGYDKDATAVALSRPDPGFAYGDSLYYPLLSSKANSEAVKQAQIALNTANEALATAKTDAATAAAAKVAAQTKKDLADAVQTAANAWKASTGTEQAYKDALAAYDATAVAAVDADGAITQAGGFVSAETGKLSTATTNDTNAKQAVVDKTTIVAEKQAAYDAISNTNFKYVYEYDAVRSAKIKQSWDSNGKAVKNVELVKKKTVSNENLAEKYIYFVAVNTNSSTSTNVTDLNGKIQLQKSGDNGFTYDQVQVDVAVELQFPMAADAIITPDLQLFKEGNGFAGDTEDELRFSADDNSYFTVNTVGQGKLLLAMNTRFDAEIAGRFPTANLDFFNGNGASFNKLGTLTLSADKGSHLYKINKDGSLTQVKATYDEYEEAFVLKTRTLDRYLVSDVELKNVSAPEVNDNSSSNGSSGSNGGVTVTPGNPNTGAAV